MRTRETQRLYENTIKMLNVIFFFLVLFFEIYIFILNCYACTATWILSMDDTLSDILYNTVSIKYSFYFLNDNNVEDDNDGDVTIDCWMSDNLNVPRISTETIALHWSLIQRPLLFCSNKNIYLFDHIQLKHIQFLCVCDCNLLKFRSIFAWYYELYCEFFIDYINQLC